MPLLKCPLLFLRTPGGLRRQQRMSRGESQVCLTCGRNLVVPGIARGGVVATPIFATPRPSGVLGREDLGERDALFGGGKGKTVASAPAFS